MRDIEERTSLPLAIEAIYRYVVFLPSKQHADVPVPNRFFAVSEGGGARNWTEGSGVQTVDAGWSHAEAVGVYCEGNSGVGGASGVSWLPVPVLPEAGA